MPIMTVSIRRVTKTGNSLTIAIPKELRRELELHRGDQVVLWAESPRRIIIQKLDEAAVQKPGFRSVTEGNGA